MAEELRLVLTIIGVLAIGGILGHGLWSVRKNRDGLREYKKPPRTEPGLDGAAKSESSLDDHGVGKPRTLGSKDSSKESNKASGQAKQEPIIGEGDSGDGVSTQPAIDDADQSADQGTTSFSATDDVVEPELQVLDNDEPTSQASTSQEPPQPVADKVEPDVIEPSEVLILHVSMPDNQTIAGASLLPMLVSMGLKFGEMDIFHRHENDAGVGSVLFSLASMYNPGTFDIDNMEQMSTRGLSLFMTLPCPGDALKNFNMMHNAAKKVADEFDAQILDSHRSVMTVQTTRHYIEKIREFERKQLING